VVQIANKILSKGAISFQPIMFQLVHQKCHTTNLLIVCFLKIMLKYWPIYAQQNCLTQLTNRGEYFFVIVHLFW